jgi:hypothetical protein
LSASEHGWLSTYGWRLYNLGPMPSFLDIDVGVDTDVVLVHVYAYSTVRMSENRMAVELDWGEIVALRFRNLIDGSIVKAHNVNPTCRI